MSKIKIIFTTSPLTTKKKKKKSAHLTLWLYGQLSPQVSKIKSVWKQPLLQLRYFLFLKVA